MFQTKRLSITNSLTWQAIEKENNKPICTNKSIRTLDWKATTTRRFDCRPVENVRITGTQLLNTFQQKYSRKDLAVKELQKKRQWRIECDNFKVNRHMSPVMLIQMKHAIEKLQQGQPLDSLSNKRGKFIEKLNDNYWTTMLDSLESRLTIKLPDNI